MLGYSLESAVDSSILLYVFPSPRNHHLLIESCFKVTLGMCLIGAVPWLRGLFIFIAQIIGAMCAAAVVSALFPGPLSVATTLAGGTNIAQGLFIEMFLTAELVFTIFMLAAEKHKGTFIAPVGIGLALFIAELTGNGLFTIAHI